MRSAWCASRSQRRRLQSRAWPSGERGDDRSRTGARLRSLPLVGVSRLPHFLDRLGWGVAATLRTRLTEVLTRHHEILAPRTHWRHQLDRPALFLEPRPDVVVL